MKTKEAIQEIENWLLVPIDFESILPALAVLRHNSEFKYYVKRVADAEFKMPSDIVQDVDRYIMYNQGSRGSQSVKDLTIKEDLRTHKADAHADSHLPARSKRPKRKVNRKGEIVPCCQRCSGMTVKKTVSKIQPLGWILFVVCIFVLPIFCFIPLIVFQDKVQKYWCPNCKRMQDIDG